MTRGAGGKLIVFEGPDGVGKSSIAAEVRASLAGEGRGQVSLLAFPGKDEGTLGRHVYQLHHDPEQFGIRTMSAASLQLLHVAAHLDSIATSIRPRVERGEVVLLDRYWWSTWVYGVTTGAEKETLTQMIELERAVWGTLQPDVLFLVLREASLRTDEDDELFRVRCDEYLALAGREQVRTQVVKINNNGVLQDAATAVLRHLRPQASSATQT